MSREGCLLEGSRWVTGEKSQTSSCEVPGPERGRASPRHPSAVFHAEVTVVPGTAARRRSEGRGGRPAGAQPRWQPPRAQRSPSRAAGRLGRGESGRLHTRGRQTPRAAAPHGAEGRAPPQPLPAAGDGPAGRRQTTRRHCGRPSARPGLSTASRAGGDRLPATTAGAAPRKAEPGLAAPPRSLTRAEAPAAPLHARPRPRQPPPPPPLPLPPPLPHLKPAPRHRTSGPGLPLGQSPSGSSETAPPGGAVATKPANHSRRPLPDAPRRTRLLSGPRGGRPLGLPPWGRGLAPAPVRLGAGGPMGRW